MTMLLKSQKGIGAILILLGVAFIIVIAVIAYFLFKSSADKAKLGGQPQSSPSTSNETVTSDQVPLKICPTGDPEQCEDPVSNADVDNIQTIEED